MKSRCLISLPPFFSTIRTFLAYRPTLCDIAKTQERVAFIKNKNKICYKRIIFFTSLFHFLASPKSKLADCAYVHYFDVQTYKAEWVGKPTVSIYIHFKSMLPLCLKITSSQNRKIQRFRTDLLNSQWLFVRKV